MNTAGATASNAVAAPSSGQAARPLDVAFVSVVPSPYQRDIFRALATRPEVRLRVFYLEEESPDSPWPRTALAPYESILPGTWLPLGSARVHLNKPPDLRSFNVVVLNSLMSLTAQWLMRVPLRNRPWIFWGERLSHPSNAAAPAWHRALTAPLNQAAAIAAIGSWAEREYRERFPEPRHVCIPYCCDLDPFLSLPRRQRADGEVVFLFCGQMIARKGVDLLLQAFTQLVREGARVRLMLVGREAELPQLLAALPTDARERIEYCGFQPPDQLAQFFARADVFVLPSRYDGWGVVVNQAIGAGLPCICSDAVGAAHDLVEDGVNGMKFCSGDTQALAAALRGFVNEPERIDAWGAASREKARAVLPETGAAKWIEALSMLAAE